MSDDIERELRYRCMCAPHCNVPEECDMCSKEHCIYCTGANTIEDLRAENARLKGALEVPKVWTEEERDGMMNAWRSAREKHGMNETIFAMAAWLLRYRAAKALGETT